MRDPEVIDETTCRDSAEYRDDGPTDMIRLAFSAALRNSASRISGDTTFDSANTNNAVPRPATSSKAMFC